MVTIQVTRGRYTDFVQIPHDSVMATDKLYSVSGHIVGDLHIADASMILHGSGFTYDNGQLLGGTINSIEYEYVGQAFTLFGYYYHGGAETISGLNLPASSFMATYAAQDAWAMRRLLYPEGVLFIGFRGTDDVLPPSEEGWDGGIGTGNDTLIGGAGENGLRGWVGDDYIVGADSEDRLDGDAGNDIIFGAGGYDHIDAGAGQDTVLAGDFFDLVYGDTGNDFLFGEAGDDTLLAGDGDDFAAGGADNDYVAGETGADYLMGEDGADTLSGGVANDVLVGGAGADVLLGQDGADALFGGTGNDYFVGGSGNDYFYALHDGPNAGEFDMIDGFEIWTSGTADYLVLPAAYQSATSIFDQGGYTWVATQTAGGTHYIAITGASAAFVTAQTVWL